jgi:tight adherence protein C
MPKQRAEQSRLRKRLGYAGVYSPAGMHIFVGSKIVLLCGGALAGLMIGSGADSVILALWLVCMLGLLGMALPGMWLSYRIRQRQRTLQASLPDALDLMVVCVEAGSRSTPRSSASGRRSPCASGHRHRAGDHAHGDAHRPVAR